MKRMLLISSLILVFSCKKENERNVVDHLNLSDKMKLQADPDSLDSEKTLNSVERIIDEYSLANTKLLSKKLDSASFIYECDERSGNVVYYSEKGILKVIKHFTADSHFSSTEEYFINNNQPYFIFTDETVWSFDGGTPEKPETKDDVVQKRMYFSNNNLIQCLEKNFTVKSNSAHQLNPDSIPNRESKNCTEKEIKKNFAKLFNNKDKKGSIKCL